MTTTTAKPDDIGKCRMDDGLNDICSNQDLQTKQNITAEKISNKIVFSGRTHTVFRFYFKTNKIKTSFYNSPTQALKLKADSDKRRLNLKWGLHYPLKVQQDQP